MKQIKGKLSDVVQNNEVQNNAIKNNLWTYNHENYCGFVQFIMIKYLSHAQHEVFSINFRTVHTISH